MKVSDSDCVNTEAHATRKQSRGITTLEVRNALSRKLHKAPVCFATRLHRQKSFRTATHLWHSKTIAVRCGA